MLRLPLRGRTGEIFVQDSTGNLSAETGINGRKEKGNKMLDMGGVLGDGRFSWLADRRRR